MRGFDAVLLPDVVPSAVDAERRHFLQHLVRQQFLLELGAAYHLPLPAATPVNGFFWVDEAVLLELS